MNNLAIYCGSLFILIGSIFLFVPLFYLELGRPKDLIRSFLNLIVGLVLIINNKIIDESNFLILLLLTVIVVLFVMEIFSTRWNQLTDKEKKKLTSFLEFKNNLSKILKAINLGVVSYSTKTLNFLNFVRNNQKITPKKWVRNDKNDNIKV